MTISAVLFIGERSKWSELASAYATSLFPQVTSVFWDFGDAYPNSYHGWKGELILSFKSDLILSANILESANYGAINFHPAPPIYRGIGGYYYAIANRDSTFAATCHWMSEEIDAGKIIDVSDFRIPDDFDAADLRELTAFHALEQFKRITRMLASGCKLPESDKKWSPKLYTRAMLAKWLSGREESTPNEMGQKVIQDVLI